jgi:signal transduction histidine kinase
MIRSLYLRVALTFIIAVLLGLVVAYFANNYWYRDSFESELQNELMNSAQDIVQTVRQMKGNDLDSYMNSLHWMRCCNVTVFDSAQQKSNYGLKGDYLDIPSEVVERVIRGETVQQSGEPVDQLVGYPFKMDGRSYAVFVQPAPRKAPANFRNILLTMLLLTLLIGSLFVLIAARYLVKPLKGMTDATRRISKGDFKIDLVWKRRSDELGELARSISHMAEELKQLEQMRQDFVSSVSHEIQSPLTSIAGFSKLVQMQEMQVEERNQYLDIIRTESERVSRLSENLLKLTSLESEHHPYHPEPYRLDEQIRRIIAVQEPIWSAKSLRFDLVLPPVMISGDEDQLSQVWINLLNNAIKFTSIGGTIQLKLELMIDHVLVNISDSGIGISDEEIPHIFERFYKADRSRQRDVGGSGLGLSIVRKIIDLHGGSITVQSVLGEGSVFQVILPSVGKKKNG